LIKYKAYVYNINPYVDENGMVIVRLKIISDKEFSKSILFPVELQCYYKVPLGKVLLVSKDAVIFRNGKAVVFTCENGKAKWHYVKTGKDNGKEVEIKDGLELGQKVITTNNLQLSNDAPVQEIN